MDDLEPRSSVFHDHDDVTYRELLRRVLFALPPPGQQNFLGGKSTRDSTTQKASSHVTRQLLVTFFTSPWFAGDGPDYTADLHEADDDR